MNNPNLAYFVADAIQAAGGDAEVLDDCEVKVTVDDWEFTLNVCNIDVVA
jgi:hypothetical protein